MVSDLPWLWIWGILLEVVRQGSLTLKGTVRPKGRIGSGDAKTCQLGTLVGLCSVLEVAKTVGPCEQLPTAGLSAGTRGPVEEEGGRLTGYPRCPAYQPWVLGFPKP